MRTLFRFRNSSSDDRIRESNNYLVTTAEQVNKLMVPAKHRCCRERAPAGDRLAGEGGVKALRGVIAWRSSGLSNGREKQQANTGPDGTELEPTDET
jgi:hypothetical protein